MSHSVTITRTTTTTSGSSTLVLNTGYMKTFPGLLKLAQLILGAVIVGILGYYIRRLTYLVSVPASELFFFTIAVAFLIGTFCLLLSCIISLSTGGIISKTIYELIYHTIAFILYLAASIAFLVEVVNKTSSRSSVYDWYLAASVLGLIVSGLYLLSAFLAQRSYRGI
ncbi:CKLF-like MARVEL transmembrane domain-containing protein 8 [Phlebotomus argentipes]|uniref:CKLF-like MARVEL transmembrane domain-containing protein 8 n=1 Tax=Phlebotomus argentipes TaxID=94469 RepID=UPI0028931DC7|nr:CKLF-like MARVEL transmembrane domain-containing protein 8 [Phlebotomus argentipes]XP_059618003.1 CKLF-like MARVEL transmembrane domain-containing protein 8 [Phlebotomus argentipes]